MATVTYDGGHFVVSETVSNGSSLTFDASDSRTGMLEVHTISHGTDCDVILRIDTDGDGSFEQSVTLDSFSGEGVSAGNEIEILQTQSMQLKIDNTGSGSADYIITGEEVDR